LWLAITAVAELLLSNPASEQLYRTCSAVYNCPVQSPLFGRRETERQQYYSFHSLTTRCDSDHSVRCKARQLTNLTVVLHAARPATCQFDAASNQKGVSRRHVRFNYRLESALLRDGAGSERWTHADRQLLDHLTLTVRA